LSGRVYTIQREVEGRGEYTKDSGAKLAGGQLTATTKAECEFILSSFIDSTNWKELVGSTNEQFEQNRYPQNVKRHWNDVVKKALLALYKD
jgi:hypothetical protein